MIQTTTFEAYTHIKPKINNRCLEVYTALRMYGPMTNQEISDRIKWPINCITPRILELRSREIDGRPAPLVESKGDKIGENGRRAIVWGIADGDQQSFL